MADEEEHLITADTEPESAGDWWSGDRTGPGKIYHMRVSRKLTDEESERVGPMCSKFAFDEEDHQWDMVKILWCIKEVAPDVEIVAWWHSPYNIFVRGLYPPLVGGKIYEILNAMNLKTAKEAARTQWKEQYGHLGIKATIAEVRKATQKDFRKAQEIK